jgi:transcriptional regulator with XRE-family HTH domain
MSMPASVQGRQRGGKGSLPFPGGAGSVALMSRPGNSDVLAAVGPRLRRLRERRELTLSALAAKTGISKSTLSRLENGERKPSLELLLPLAEAFHLPLDELVGAPRVGDPRVRMAPKTRNGRLVYPLSGASSAMAVWKVVIPPERERRLRTHAGYEWLYVLSGEMRLILGKHDIVMGPGEVAEFDTRLPHWFGPTGDEPVEILSVHGAHGERMHVRAAAREEHHHDA